MPPLFATLPPSCILCNAGEVADRSEPPVTTYLATSTPNNINDLPPHATYLATYHLATC
jgi:hypothetical protein